MSTTIEPVVAITASPATEMPMWTTEAGLTSWWGTTATVDPRAGGEIVVDIAGDHVMVGEFGEFGEFDPSHRATFTFGSHDGEPAPGTTTVQVDFDFAANADADATILTLFRAGVPVAPVQAPVRGWEHFLDERPVATGSGT